MRRWRGEGRAGGVWCGGRVDRWMGELAGSGRGLEAAGRQIFMMNTVHIYFGVGFARSASLTTS